MSDKIPVIENLLNKVDSLIIGGGASLYLPSCAERYEVRTSILDTDRIEMARNLLAKAQEKGVKLLLPLDVQAASAFKNDASSICCTVDSIPADRMGLDIGEKTIELFTAEIELKTIVWNGPMGVFEMSILHTGRLRLRRRLQR